jgi:hypothetical protein
MSAGLLRRALIALAIALCARPALAFTYFCTVLAQPTSDNGTYAAATGDITVTPCSSIPTGSLVIIDTDQRDTPITLTIGTTGGQTWTSGTLTQSGSSSSRGFWAVFNGTWSANPVVSADFHNAVPWNVIMTVYQACTGGTVASDVAESTGNYSADANVTVTGQTPTSMASVVTRAAFMAQENVTFSSLTAGWTYRSGGANQFRNSTATGLSLSIVDKIQASASATGDVTNVESVASFAHIRIQTWKETGCTVGSPSSALGGAVGGVALRGAR